jgi:hypothetical protein
VASTFFASGMTGQRLHDGIARGRQLQGQGKRLLHAPQMLDLACGKVTGKSFGTHVHAPKKQNPGEKISLGFAERASHVKARHRLPAGLGMVGTTSSRGQWRVRQV